MVHYNWNLEQRSPEWKASRVGNVGGSEAIGLTTPARMKTLVLTKATEILTGEIEEIYVNDAMQRGIDNEERVVLDYELSKGVPVRECGQVLNTDYPCAALSPDGLLIDENNNVYGAVEIKCPSSKTHIQTVLEGAYAKKNEAQLIHYFMMIPTLEYVDFISWDDRVPHMETYTYRVKREDVEKLIEKAIVNHSKFVKQLDKALDRFGLV
jgi:hypothetical protein